VKTRYVYNAQIMRVIDGDSVEMTVDCGFGIAFRMKARLYSINAPEMNTDEGKAAKEALHDLLSKYSLATERWSHTVKTHKQSSRNPMDASGKYGRWLVEIVGKDKATGKVVNLNRELVALGHATDYLLRSV